MELAALGSRGDGVRKYPVAVDDADDGSTLKHDATPPPTTHAMKASFFTISYYARGTRGEGALC